MSLSRRALLTGMMGAVVGGCATATRPPRDEVDELPLFDVHSHMVSPAAGGATGYAPQDLLRAMDAAGIRRMVVLGFGDDVAILARSRPGRVVASYGGYISFKYRQARGEIGDGTAPAEVEQIGSEFEQALASGAYRGLGEIHTYARPIPAAVTGGTRAVPGSTIRPGSPLILRLMALAGRHGGPINIHCDNYGVGEMVSALRANPKTTVVWAHTGSFLPPADIQAILLDHPNVVFDLSAKNSVCCALGFRLFPFLDNGIVDVGWRQLFEKYPARFLIGVDFFSARHLQAAREAGDFLRTMLRQLAPPTARAIAYENAERVYGLRT